MPLGNKPFENTVGKGEIARIMIHSHIIGNSSKFCHLRPFEKEGVIVNIHPEHKHEDPIEN